MLNDQCDFVGCDNTAEFEIEESDGNCQFVCKKHANGKEIVRDTSNLFTEEKESKYIGNGRRVALKK
jgi:hypothetical protein